MRRAASVLALSSTLLTATSAQVDVGKLGPQIGDRAIDFRLVDQSGRARTLGSVAGPKGTMLVFCRSADW